LNDVNNIADKHKEQLQQLVMVYVGAGNVGGGGIVMTCLHEYHPLFPCAVV
jgi:NAD(P)H-hydrate repair Nnr-like enzyme with NAD(P)H-hydrate epimerase domain